MGNDRSHRHQQDVINMPGLGFIDTLKYSAMLLLISLAGILVSGVLYFVLFAIRD